MAMKGCTNKFVWFLVLVLGFGLFGNAGVSHASIEPTTKSKQTLVLKHANIVDVRTGDVAKDQTIIITENKISYIGDDDNAVIPKHAKVRDASGQYVIPGLWDMHVHLQKEHAHAFPLFLANGVTGIREMGAALSDIDAWKKATKKGTMAPRIHYAGSTIIETKARMPHLLNVKSEKQAREAVRTNARKGADHLKVYSNMSPSIYAAIADEAKKYRLPITGHLPIHVRAIDAVRAGQKSMEHLNGLFIATSTKEAELLKKPDIETRDVTYELIAEKHYDPKRAEKLFKAFVQNEVYQVPTLITPWNLIKTDLDPRAKYVPPAIQKEWIKFIKLGEEMKDTEEYKLTAAYAKIMGGMVKKMNDAGVPIMTGTDSTFGMPNFVFGFSLHDELKRLVDNGLTPLQALQAATINPTRYLERVHELGTVEEGKIADLVLLEANPLEDIQHTTRISAVIINGKLMEKKELYKPIKTYKILKMEDVKVDKKRSKSSKSTTHNHGLHAH